ncbi:hypothetical protein [Aliikangiella coralliicola]|uniref:Uncharacterized protein n=1 Tax=Aliikangiella coralliicola TaxID=2592383 RepID=A0A545UIY8_9GAMM|nr:hypothetical protein [Aliikangiella coralliicola]TQV89425.1 hypothetical protein FLL46_00650 [Aliikangiella coralliicola]
MKKLTTLTAAISFALLGQHAIAKGGINMDDMLGKADLVIQGKVVDISYKDSAEGLPHTFVTYKVDELISGATGQKEITLRFIGGQKKEGHVIRYLSVSDVPEFEQGESDVLFISKNNQAICPLVSCSKGRFRNLSGIVASEDGQPLLLTANQTYELGRESMIGQIASTNRKEGFSKGVSNVQGESAGSAMQSKKGAAMLDVVSFVANLKERAYAMKSKGKIRQSIFKSANIKTDFSTSLFKAAAPKSVAKTLTRDAQQKQAQTNRSKSDFDRWEEEMVRKNGGDPVITKPQGRSTLRKQN